MYTRLSGRSQSEVPATLYLGSIDSLCNVSSTPHPSCLLVHISICYCFLRVGADNAYHYENNIAARSTTAHSWADLGENPPRKYDYGGDGNVIGLVGGGWCGSTLDRTARWPQEPQHSCVYSSLPAPIPVFTSSLDRIPTEQDAVVAGIFVLHACCHNV